jgi:hypothetical protein
MLPQFGTVGRAQIQPRPSTTTAEAASSRGEKGVTTTDQGVAWSPRRGNQEPFVAGEVGNGRGGGGSNLFEHSSINQGSNTNDTMAQLAKRRTRRLTKAKQGHRRVPYDQHHHHTSRPSNEYAHLVGVEQGASPMTYSSMSPSTMTCSPHSLLEGQQNLLAASNPQAAAQQYQQLNIMASMEMPVNGYTRYSLDSPHPSMVTDMYSPGTDFQQCTNADEEPIPMAYMYAQHQDVRPGVQAGQKLAKLPSAQMIHNDYLLDHQHNQQSAVMANVGLSSAFQSPQQYMSARAGVAATLEMVHTPHGSTFTPQDLSVVARGYAAEPAPNSIHVEPAAISGIGGQKASAVEQHNPALPTMDHIQNAYPNPSLPSASHERPADAVPGEEDRANTQVFHVSLGDGVDPTLLSSKEASFEISPLQLCKTATKEECHPASPYTFDDLDSFLFAYDSLSENAGEASPTTAHDAANRSNYSGGLTESTATPEDVFGNRPATLVDYPVLAPDFPPISPLRDLRHEGLNSTFSFNNHGADVDFDEEDFD